ncbi:FAD:protein FMN transferase [Schumannella luteola]|nr:FAD:protein FMN transferase [Schumannella luteola]
MGTEASIVGSDLTAAVIAEVERGFADVDARFSLYRPDSELSRVAAGSLRLDDASDDLRGAYARALAWRARTDGAFTAHRPDGVVDLSGVVKALAMADAAALLDAGSRDWQLGVGGDLCWSAGGTSGPFGIVDPADRSAVLAAVVPAASRRALATSGSAERGEHIWTRLDLPVSPFVQVSVLADDIVTADVLATAIVAGGEATLDLATERWDVDVLTVDRAGELRATPGMRAAIRSAAPVG